MNGIHILLSGLIILGLAGTSQSKHSIDDEVLVPSPAVDTKDSPLMAVAGKDASASDSTLGDQVSRFPTESRSPQSSPYDPLIPSNGQGNLFQTGYCTDAGVFEAGASLLLLKPYTQSNTAYSVSSGSSSTSGSNTSTTGLTSIKSFDWNYSPAAEFWLGFRSNSGFGVRVGYFTFDQSSGNASISETGAQASAGQVISPSPFTPTYFPNVGAPVPGRYNFGSPGFLLNGPGVPPNPVGQDNLQFGSRLRVNAFDFEGTYASQVGNWTFLTGAGGRYLSLAQSYHGQLNNSGGGTGDSETQTLNLFHRFTGAGPTISGLATWKVAQSNLSVFGRGRGSLLVGTNCQTAAFAQSVNDPAGLAGTPGSFNFNSSIPSTADSIMPVADLELGLNYSWCLWNARWNSSASVINQNYFGAGNASRSDGNLSLFGCQLGLGVNF